MVEYSLARHRKIRQHSGKVREKGNKNEIPHETIETLCVPFPPQKEVHPEE